MFFSVIVPVYRVEVYLRACVDSVLGQTFDDFELILVDDGSPDNCPEICDAYASADERVQVIHKANGGPASARKAGIQMAIGEYVVYVDGDDWLMRDALEYLYNVIKESWADVVLPAKQYEYADGTRIVRECLAEGLYCGDALERQVYPLILMDERMEHLGFQQIGTAIRRILLYPCQIAVEDELKLGEDLMCMVDVYQAMGSVYVCDRAVYHYRIREDSLSHGFDEKIYDRFLGLLRVLMRRVPETGSDFSEKVDRYASFMCFLLMERVAEARAFRQLKRVGRQMEDPLIREALSRAHFVRLKTKRRIVLFFMKRCMFRTAYVFLRGYGVLKSGVYLAWRYLGRREQLEERNKVQS